MLYIYIYTHIVIVIDTFPTPWERVPGAKAVVSRRSTQAREQRDKLTSAQMQGANVTEGTGSEVKRQDSDRRTLSKPTTPVPCQTEHGASNLADPRIEETTARTAPL